MRDETQTSLLEETFDRMAANWPSELVARKRVGEFTGGMVSPKSMANYDSLKIGPPQIKIGRNSGYGLTGKAERHILPILWGAGRNGKGTLLETVKHVLGDYAYKAESELLLEQRQARNSGSPNSGILALRGKRIVWCSETDDGRRLNASKIKELVGGDTLNARAVYPIR